jgi:hypothetical protein
VTTQKNHTPPTPQLRFRQVHLDFHTSPLIPGVGADFEPDTFARTLREAHIDSITCFAVCHHGMFYLYDVSLAVRTGWTPGAAYLAPERMALPVTMGGRYAWLRVPKVDGHAIVVLEH